MSLHFSFSFWRRRGERQHAARSSRTRRLWPSIQMPRWKRPVRYMSPVLDQFMLSRSAAGMRCPKHVELARIWWILRCRFQQHCTWIANLFCCRVGWYEGARGFLLVGSCKTIACASWPMIVLAASHPPAGLDCKQNPVSSHLERRPPELHRLV